NAYGLMFCPEPQRAVNEAGRVLAPGGRFALVTWDEPSKSPFFGVITSVAAPLLSLAEPEPGSPGPFRLASVELLESMLRAGGLVDVRVESRSATFEVGSPGEYCRVFGDLAWKARIARLSDAQRAGFEHSVTEASRPFVREGRLRLAATSLCASGRK